MARGGRRKVSIYTKRDRANKRWLKKVEKAVLPSRRTQRAIVRAAFTPTAGRQRSQPSRTTWAKVMLSKKQLLGCFIAGTVCSLPALSPDVFDGSSVACAVIFYFFSIPFLVVCLICMKWNEAFRTPKESQDNNATKETPVNVPAAPNEEPEEDEEPEEESINDSDNFKVEVYDAHVTNPEWMGDYVEISDKLTAQMLSPQLIKQLNDSVKILNTTTNPEVFFQRYDFCIGRLSILRECEPYVSYKSGESPTIAYHRFKHQDHFDKATVSLIHRVERKYTAKIESLKTKKAKLNWAGKFYDEFIPYLGIMGVQAQTEAGEISAKLYDLADADPLEA